jgi:hypothetical protein
MIYTDMKHCIKLKHRIHRNHGMTLIEITIFTVLLSLLIGNMINYLYTIHFNNIKLMNEIEKAQKGFVATTAVILLSIGTLAFLVATMTAASLFADSVDHREARIQKTLNEIACQETLPLLVAKDYFLSGKVELSDLGCVINR